jgi:hypothetical protein
MNKEMPKSLKRWERVRQKGKAKFILQNGLLMYGLPLFILDTFVCGPSQKLPFSPELIVRHACIWAVAGLFFGWTIWTFSEKKYEKFIAKPSEPEQT